MKRFPIFSLLLSGLLGVLFMTLVTPVRANTTLVVNSTEDLTDASPGDGVCETATGSGVCTLRAAIQEANALAGAETIELPAGTYSITREGFEDNTAYRGDFDIKSDLTIHGAGAQNTILDGNSENIGERIFDVYAPAQVTISDLSLQHAEAHASGGGIRSNATLTIDGLVIHDIVMGDRSSAFFGAGIANYGSLTVTNSTITKNRCYEYAAGGIYNAGTLQVTNSTISDNQCLQQAGGIMNAQNSTAVLKGVTLTGNSAGPGDGGAILNNGTIRLIDSFVSNNTADGGNGGAIENFGTLFAKNVTFSKNGASAGGAIDTSGQATLQNVRLIGNQSHGYGGAIQNTGTLTLVNSSLSGNSTGGGGGIQNAGSVFLDRVTISGNTAGVGAGINTVSDTPMMLTNVTLSGNSASWYGGAINFTASSSASLTNVSVIGNSAPKGAGIYYDYWSNSKVQLKNTLIANNAGGNCAADSGTFTLTSYGHNLDSGASCGLSASGDLSNTDPRVGPLARHGGATLTHALLQGSPAINAGTIDGCPATDQRGVHRPFGASCEIGAYEAAPPRKPRLHSPENGASLTTPRPLFDWKNAADATSYQIQVRQNSKDGTFAVRAKTNSSKYTPSKDLAPSGSPYFWHVRACNWLGCSPWTAYWNFTILAPRTATPTSTPTGTETPSITPTETATPTATETNAAALTGTTP